MTKDVDLIFMAWALDFERSDGGRYVGVSLFHGFDIIEYRRGGYHGESWRPENGGFSSECVAEI